MLSSVRSTLTLNPSAASFARLGWAGTVSGAHGAVTTRVGAAALGTSVNIPPTLLAPNGTTHVLVDAFSFNLQPGGNDGSSFRTVLVPSDFRVHSITLS